MLIVSQQKYISKYVRRKKLKPNRVIKLPVFRTMFHPVAQKEWKCCICHRPIEKGKRYTHYIDRRVHEIIHSRFHDACFMMTEAYCLQRDRKEFMARSVRNWLINNHCKECGQGCQLYPCEKIMKWVKTKMKEFSKNA